MQSALAGRIGTPTSISEADTLAARLERAVNQIEQQMQRMDGVISRVNGQPPANARGEPGPLMALSLSAGVERVEALAKRACEIVDGLERIA